MKRVNSKNLNTINNGSRINSFVIASGEIEGVLTLKNGDYDILIKDLNKNQSLVIDCLEDTNLKLSIFANNELENLNIKINCYRNTNLNAYFADFSKDTNKVNVSIYLKEEGATANWHLASLTSKHDNKEFYVSAIHESKNTYAKVDSYGVCKDSGKLIFAGVSHILNKSINSKTYQNAKIMVFDKSSIAIAKPILKIDENDVEASHGAVVGKINDDHLFYLTSRGLSEAEAKELITFGYLKPILAGFNDSHTREYLSSLIERRM